VAEAVVADRAQASRQDVAQVTSDELDPRERELPGSIPVGSILPTERDVLGIDAKDARIADRATSHVGPEVFDGRVPRTDGADMYAPVEGPDLGIDLPLVFVEQATHVFAEGGSQMRQRHEERRIGNADRLLLSVEPRAGHEAVQMGMEEQALVPCVEDHREAAESRLEILLVGGI